MLSLIELADQITTVDAQYHRPGLAAFYLVRAGRAAAFIDTGTSRSLPHALEALHRHGLKAEDVAYVIPTHVHLDHAGGAGEMLRRFPNARLVIHPRGARHMIDPARLMAGVTEVYGAEEVARSFGEVPPIAAERMIEAPDNFALDFNGRQLRFLDTPGHARHHFCVWDERSGSVFAGDTFGVSYRELDTARGAFVFPTTTPVQFEPVALHDSIDRLVALKPRQILLTHFGAVTEIERLAADLHVMIDDFCDMARAVRGTGEERHTRLVEGQRALITLRLEAHGCTLPAREAERLLANDYQLNAQGLAVWLDRETRA